MSEYIPVITLDGPAGAGKSTLAQALAARLGFAMLASGSIYRLIGLYKLEHRLSDDDLEQLLAYARTLQHGNWLEDIAVMADRLTSDDVSTAASKIASIPELRLALLDLQRSCATTLGHKGLVAEGRDMGTVVFPAAMCKFFITASPQVRARRRCLQQGEAASEYRLAQIATANAARDSRDAAREVAPLKPAPDAVVVDTSELGLSATLARLMGCIERRT